MSAVASTSTTAARLSSKTSLRNSRIQRISATARPCRRVSASRGFVVKAEEALTNGNGTLTSSTTLYRGTGAGVISPALHALQSIPPGFLVFFFLFFFPPPFPLQST